MIIVNDEETRNFYTSQLEFCDERSSRRLNLCGCFTKQLVPVFVTAEAVKDLPRKDGHWWISDKWVTGHQISHWAEKLVNMHSVMQDWESYQLPEISGMALLKDTPPMTNHEESIFNIATSSLNSSVASLWMPDFEDGGICFEQVCLALLCFAFQG